MMRMVNMNLLLNRFPSPIGTILLVSDGEALCALKFQDREGRVHCMLRRYCGIYSLTPTRDAGAIGRALGAYFEGDLMALEGIPVQTRGTEFQTSVWAALRRIPAGTTATYSGLAEQIGRPAACRAVGLANGSNPIAIVVPCHRVIGADGRLTGYGGGVARKEWLLRHEAGMSGDLFQERRAA